MFQLFGSSLDALELLQLILSLFRRISCLMRRCDGGIEFIFFLGKFSALFEKDDPHRNKEQSSEAQQDDNIGTAGRSLN